MARELLPNANVRVLRYGAASAGPAYSNGCFSHIADAFAFAPQIAVIASPAPFHAATAHALAAIGVQILIEKALAAALTGVAQLLEKYRKQAAIVLIAYNFRFYLSFQRCSELLQEHAIGKFFMIGCVGMASPARRL